MSRLIIGSPLGWLCCCSEQANFFGTVSSRRSRHPFETSQHRPSKARRRDVHPKAEEAGRSGEHPTSVLALGKELWVHLCEAVSFAPFIADCHVQRVVRQPRCGGVSVCGRSGIAVQPSRIRDRVPDGSSFERNGSLPPGVLYSTGPCNRTGLP